MRTATAVPAINVVYHAQDGNLAGLQTDGGETFDSYKSAPAAVEFEGRVYGKSGWNSDTGRIYYRTDVPWAKPCG